MDGEPEDATPDQPRNLGRRESIRALAQVGEILLKVFLATALTVGVLRTRDIEAQGGPAMLQRVAVARATNRGEILGTREQP